MLTIDVIAPALPPQLDGIGDYSARIATELAKTCSVRILTVTGQAHTPIPGVEIVPVFTSADPASVKALLPLIAARKPDWVFLQYNPFSYGKRGFNPYLPNIIGQIKRQVPGTRLALMAHETFVPFDNLRNRAMSCWQIPQFYFLGRASDRVFLSIEPWANHYKSWFPKTPVLHLPVGSNIPFLKMGRTEAKQRLGIAPDTLVIGIFGQAHISRRFDWMAAAFRRVSAEIPTTLLYIGPSKEVVTEAIVAEEKAEGTATKGRVIAEGPFPAEEVSLRLSAIDIMLTPYVDGVSTRRGAFMAGLQHGVAAVGTFFLHTDTMLLEVNNKAFVLTPVDDKDAFVQSVLGLAHDSAKRDIIGKAGQEYYKEQFAWEAVAHRLLVSLTEEAVDTHEVGVVGAAK